MKKTFICAAVVGALALAAGIDTTYAQSGGHGGGSAAGGHGGGSAAGGHGGGSAAGGHGGGNSGWHGGNNGWRGGSGNWNRGNWNRGNWNRGFRGRSSFGIVIGAPFGYWGAGYYPYYYPYYDPYYYPYPVYGGAVYADPIYDSPQVYGESAPAYTEQDPGYRYYCPNPAGYFPSVQNCATGWLKVVPDSGAPSAPPAYQPRQ